MPIKDIISLGIGPSTTPGLTYFITFGLSMGAVSEIWTPVTPASGSWSTASPETGSWTTVTPASGSWTEV